MNQKENQTTAGQNKGVIAGILRRGGQILFMFVFLGLVLFLAAGSLKWTAAWVYLGISLVSVAINAYFMLRTSPETVAERGQAKGWKNWDKLVSGLWALIPAIITGGLMVVRTALEDRMLQEELAGYEEYTQEVKYRLLPGVW
jgi:protein-S-isoprenylcysteine O-methyltransferase Ste14